MNKDEKIIFDNRKIENNDAITICYDDYLKVEERHKKIFIQQIVLNAYLAMRNEDGDLDLFFLDAWLEQFKDEELVLTELEKMRNVKSFKDFRKIFNF